MLLTDKAFHTNIMVHTSLAILTILNKQTTSSRPSNINQITTEKSRQHMLQKVQSELTYAHGVSTFQKMYISKIIGVQCDKNNQGLKKNAIFFILCRLCNA
jgi:MFS-type transporter involved in bile tolerance (Atg22 family)